MRRSPETGNQERVLWALKALGGEATLGDLYAVTGLARPELERSLEALMADDQGHVRVREHGDLTYHLVDTPSELGKVSPRATARWSHRHPRQAELAEARRTLFDSKTLRLIRTREGVISLAELVEQTGLPLPRAQREMERLVASWGGEAHTGLDGHTVYAFPELMSSVHGRFATRESRPAWVRREDPMDHARVRDRRARVGVGAVGAGVATVVGAPLLAAGLGVAGTVVLATVGVSLAGLGIREVLHHHRRFRFRQPETLRRYALGYVVETALRGKGVVSLERTVHFIQGRAGKQKVSRAGVEKALRHLAAEFDAPITSQSGDLFFGFRNVKRQFLASLLVRKELGLGHTVSGETVYDTSDPPGVASARELEAFDKELQRLDVFETGNRPGAKADVVD